MLSFVKEAIFGKPLAPVPEPMAPVPCASDVGTTLQEQRRVYRQSLGRFGHLAPRQASVAAFVASLQELDLVGEWDQAELLREYDIVCKNNGATRMPAKWFWRGLDKAGCHRWRDDRDQDGQRSRPFVVWVPSAAAAHGTGAETPWPELPPAVSSIPRAHIKRPITARVAAMAGT